MIRLMTLLYFIIGLLSAEGGLIQNKASLQKQRFPKVVRITDSKLYPICMGTLIKSDVVITSAHCMYHSGEVPRLKASEYRIRIPEVQNSAKVLSNISSILVHPGFNYNRKANDVALMMLSKPVDTFEDFEILPKRIPTTDAFIATLKKHKRQDSIILYNVQSINCTFLEGDERIPSNSLCASEPLQNSRIRQGYSGSPLICRQKSDPLTSDRLCGILSFGFNTSDSHAIIFASVDSWVQSVLGYDKNPPILSHEALTNVIIIALGLTVTFLIGLLVCSIQKRSTSSQFDIVNAHNDTNNNNETITFDFELLAEKPPLLAENDLTTPKL